jgi:nucleoside-triphosphatase THEP1
MLVKVFVLGRPGSGKTTAVNHILKGAQAINVSAKSIKDYDILYDML